MWRPACSSGRSKRALPVDRRETGRGRGRRSGAGDEPVLLTGIHSVLEALRARRRKLLRLTVQPGSASEAVLEAARGAGVPVQEMPSGASASDPAEPRNQGLKLEVGPLPQTTLEELIAGASDRPGLIVALDGVEDPQNVGSIARVADAAGAQGLLLTERRAPPLGAAVSRASAGAIEWLPVARVPNLGRALNTLKEKGFWVFGCDPEEGEDLFSLPDRVVAGHRVVVLGAEGVGLRPGTQKRVDHRVRIPMGGGVASLNVASAASVVLFELQRRAHLARESASGSLHQEPAE